MSTPIRTVAVDRINADRIRAAFPLTDTKALYGYGPTIPSALSALARSIERWAMSQAEQLLAGNGGSDVR